MSDVQEAEYLYWVGCYGSFDERNKKVARAFVRLLQAAQVDFAILGNEEKCTGEPARRLGHEYLYQTLAQGNIETLKRYRFQTIVTACPHCFNTIRNEYPDFDGHFRVIHHSQLLDELVRAGRLQRRRRTATSGSPITTPATSAGTTTSTTSRARCWHRRTRTELVEMQLNRSKGFCCGGGGGRVWMEEHEGRRVNQLRVEQAMEVKPDILASACPVLPHDVRGRGEGQGGRRQDQDARHRRDARRASRVTWAATSRRPDEGPAARPAAAGAR